MVRLSVDNERATESCEAVLIGRALLSRILTEWCMHDQESLPGQAVGTRGHQ